MQHHVHVLADETQPSSTRWRLEGWVDTCSGLAAVEVHSAHTDVMLQPLQNPLEPEAGDFLGFSSCDVQGWRRFPSIG